MSTEAEVLCLKASYDPAVKKIIESLELAKKSDASKELIDSIEDSLKLSCQRDQFAEETTCKESETCTKIVAKTFSHDWQKAFDEKKTTWNCPPRMVTGHLEGQFLKSFLSAQKAKHVLEVGMFTGYSAVSIAEALPDDGEIITLDLDEYLKEMMQSLSKDSPHRHKIHIIIGNALNIMDQLAKDGETFDAIFLDGAKAEYEQYLKLCFKGNLLAPGGTILIDNAFNDGFSYMDTDSVSAKFADIVKKDQDLHVVLVPIRDGIFLIRRRKDVDGGVV